MISEIYLFFLKIEDLTFFIDSLRQRKKNPYFESIINSLYGAFYRLLLTDVHYALSELEYAMEFRTIILNMSSMPFLNRP